MTKVSTRWVPRLLVRKCLKRLDFDSVFDNLLGPTLHFSWSRIIISREYLRPFETDQADFVRGSVTMNESLVRHCPTGTIHLHICSSVVAMAAMHDWLWIHWTSSLITIGRFQPLPKLYTLCKWWWRYVCYWGLLYHQEEAFYTSELQAHHYPWKTCVDPGGGYVKRPINSTKLGPERVIHPS